MINNRYKQLRIISADETLLMSFVICYRSVIILYNKATDVSESESKAWIGKWKYKRKYI